MPRKRDACTADEAHTTADDCWAAGIDVLILRVADRLRRAGVDAAEGQLRRVAEEVVLDAAHFVLDWVEAPAMRTSDDASR